MKDRALVLQLHEVVPFRRRVFSCFISLRLSPVVAYRREIALSEGWPVPQDVRVLERFEAIRRRSGWANGTLIRN